jgi:cell wall-associated NlpC family hydrolase
MVYGYRSGLPLLYGRTEPGVDGLPRTAHAMAYNTRQVTIAAGLPDRAPDIDEEWIMPGDLVFFALRADPSRISHSGIVIGRDAGGRLRFVSSRGNTEGPSFADDDGTESTLDETVWRTSLRRIVRL